MHIDCAICEESFDLRSPEKKRAGGKRNHCPDCAEETAVPYLAVNGADGLRLNLPRTEKSIRRLGTTILV